MPEIESVPIIEPSVDLDVVDVLGRHIQVTVPISTSIDDVKNVIAHTIDSDPSNMVSFAKDFW